jgi:hypothetical protein
LSHGDSIARCRASTSSAWIGSVAAAEAWSSLSSPWFSFVQTAPTAAQIGTEQSASVLHPNATSTTPTRCGPFTTATVTQQPSRGFLRSSPGSNETPGRDNLGDHTMSNELKGTRPRLRTTTWGALVFSIAMSAISWLSPYWENSTPINAFLGDNVLTPIVLYLWLTVVAFAWDIVMIALTFGIVEKTRTRPNLIMCMVALVLLIAPFVADSIYSNAIANG